ncbi:hypothetical protein PLICRDRAFT_584336 [Plicaturopsis crispa FD-325 SS-3]|nr:hypothetical protein PLICRDRAFT_584336 [Plicaturopsis crispa FD-325 SS-3]
MSNATFSESAWSPSQLVDTLACHLSNDSSISLDCFTDNDFRALDDKIVSTLATLRRRRNESLVPAHRIPPETLAMIFEILRQEAKGFAVDTDVSVLLDRSRPEYAMHHVSQVCHLWRETALAHPLLWSSIFSINERDVATSLTRSRDALLSVELVSSYPPSRDETRVPRIANMQNAAFMATVASHSARFRDVSIRIDSVHNPHSSLTLGSFSLPAPHLESLVV